MREWTDSKTSLSSARGKPSWRSDATSSLAPRSSVQEHRKIPTGRKKYENIETIDEIKESIAESYSAIVKQSIYS
jgi:hypothetical protein